MGVCLTNSSRHADTRGNHGEIGTWPNLTNVMPIDSIIGANSEVTTAIEAHR